MAGLTRVRVLIRAHYNGRYGRSLGECQAGDIIEIPSGEYTEYLIQNGYVRLVDEFDPSESPSQGPIRLEEDIRDDNPDEPEIDHFYTEQGEDDTTGERDAKVVESPPRRGGRRKKTDE